MGTLARLKTLVLAFAAYMLVSAPAVVPVGLTLSSREFTLLPNRLYERPGVASADFSADGIHVVALTGAIDQTWVRFWAANFWGLHGAGAGVMRLLTPAKPVPWDPKRPLAIGMEHVIRYSPDGRFILAFDAADKIDLLAVTGTEVTHVRFIDLGLSSERPTFVPVDLQWCPDSKHVAVLFSWKPFHEGVVRVYDVGRNQSLWERAFNSVEMGRCAWSPDGSRLAVTLLTGEPNTAYPARNIPNLLLLDADSGRTILEINTDDQAGPVCFAPDNTIATAPIHLHLQGRGLFRGLERVKVWSATSGKVLRQISSKGRDVHNDLELSVDGKVLLAFVGKERWGPTWRSMGEPVPEITDIRFQLFNYETGKPLATSPDLKRADIGCMNHLPSFRLSAKGDRVLVYYAGADCPLEVFEVGTTSVAGP